VTVLAARDAERVLRFVADAEELAGDDPFPPTVLEELGSLVTADCVTYSEQDRVRQRFRYDAARPGEDWSDGAEVVSYWDIAAEHPICSAHNRSDFRALKLSDFLTLKQLRRSRVYALWFAPARIERELNVAIPSPPWHTKTFLFDRRRPAQDFTERDRLVLELLQPHLRRLWLTAQTRRRLKAAMTALQWASEHDLRGVVLLDRAGRIEYASPPARRLLREFCAGRGEHDLPPELARWLETSTPTVVLRGPSSRLTVRRSDNALLLDEAHEELGLTPRERQILAWVARGKTNAETAEILWVAPTTVRKHLENIYAKLGVKSRTAAAARLLGYLDREVD
jgi:DNA-binding CsgD family transcriptional regulator